MHTLPSLSVRFVSSQSFLLSEYFSFPALGAVVLAMEPLISKELVRRIKMAGPRSERLLAMVDEREAAL